jgi:hypothetical protein
MPIDFNSLDPGGQQLDHKTMNCHPGLEPGPIFESNDEPKWIPDQVRNDVYLTPCIPFRTNGATANASTAATIPIQNIIMNMSP